MRWPIEWRPFLTFDPVSILRTLLLPCWCVILFIYLFILFDFLSSAVREHQRRCVEATNTYLEKQPLFPVAVCPTLSEVNCNVSRGDDPTSLDASTVSPNSKVPKRTLAATLVESTKRQTVALVPRQIAKLAQPFYPLFNPALFPHKPPSSSVSNRVLFTDAEDE